MVRDPVSKSYSVELQLLDIYLGMPYAKAEYLLTQKFGKPTRTQNTPYIAVTFKLDAKTNNVIKVLAKSDNPSAVGSVVIIGTEPIAGLSFFSNINLGEPEAHIRLKFPKAEMEEKNNYRRYTVPFTNYLFDVKNGKVMTIGIWDQFTFTVKANGDSIDLSTNLVIIANQKGLLSEEGVLSKPEDIAKIKALIADPLRPYCKERYPLRLAYSGVAYVDINFFRNEKKTPIPATFLVDTGWIFTSITPELSQKANCEKAESQELELQFSGGIIQLGSIRDTTGMFKIITPKEFQATGKIDGVLGNTSFFEKPVFINFKHGYLCTPISSTSEVAQKLKFAKVSSEQPARGLLTDFYANNQRLKYGRVDSGADITTLSKNDIARLKLKDLNKTGKYLSVSGLHQLPLYGPVEIGWPALGITQNLQQVVVGPWDGMWTLIGMDFLRHYVLSTEFKSGDIYIGE